MKLDDIFDATGELEGVDRRLIALVIMSAVEFHQTHGLKTRCFSGFRSPQEQERLHAKGVSPVLFSKHMEGRAMDLTFIDRFGAAIWDHEFYYDFNTIIQSLAPRFDAVVVWGGHWKSVDAVHFQI